MDDEQAKNQASILNELGITPDVRRDTVETALTKNRKPPTSLEQLSAHVRVPKDELKKKFEKYIENIIGYRDWVASSPEELFAIEGTNTDSGFRSFFSFNTKGGFSASNRWHYYPEASFITHAIYKGKENGMNYTNIKFTRDGVIEIAETNGERKVEVSFDKGQASKIDFEVFDKFCDEEEKYPFIRSSLFLEDVRKLPQGVELKPEDFMQILILPQDERFGELTLRVDNDRIRMTRYKGEKVYDVIEFPLEIDVENIQQRFLPDALVRNPTLDNTDVDFNWKMSDPARVAGIEWEAMEDDEYHSMDRKGRKLESVDAQ